MRKKDKRLKKSGLTQEQLDVLDKAVYDKITQLYFKDLLDENWYNNQEDKKNE